MKTYLKIKGLSLAAEARILKRLERSRRTHPKLRESIHLHRVHEVRSEARSTHLALGFLRGRAYGKMELPLVDFNLQERQVNTTKTVPNWKRVEQLVRKYGQKYFADERAMMQAFSDWKDTGSVGVQDKIAA